ncbi:hypothetical protein KDD17_00850 [Sulfitobacter albidus]|uniref:Uncharacterized protein n=1 Tax=Sulfitobacter albidus TaxID=2829501 RepID=A0A975JDT9_9RHOB|nr:hypothetical protein [Sulfitobacter albidus]QUJ76657.1 hypothetical protein KDD17_00850 [Sulfitobacter albidus]
MLITVGLCATLPATVNAGAWLRERGKGFMSFSFASTVDLDTVSQTFIEYGYSDAMTLGADIGFVRPRNGFQGGFATLFATRAITPPDAQSKWSYTIGVGANWANDLVLPHIQTGISWGRGIKLGEKYGWATVDANVFWDVTYALHVSKLDGTVGLNFTDHVAGMMQIYFVHAAGTSATTLAPSLILSPKEGPFRIQIGAETALGDISGSVLKLGLWRDF